VVEARDLRPADANGLADPYIRIKFGEEIQETLPAPRTLAPKWHQEFKLYLIHNQLFFAFSFFCFLAETLLVGSYVAADHPSLIEIVAMDKDMKKADDFMGKTEIPIETIMAKIGIVDQYYELKAPSFTGKRHEAAGSVRLRLQYVSARVHLSFHSSLFHSSSLLFRLKARQAQEKFSKFSSSWTNYPPANKKTLSLNIPDRDALPQPTSFLTPRDYVNKYVPQTYNTQEVRNLLSFSSTKQHSFLFFHTADWSNWKRWLCESCVDCTHFRVCSEKCSDSV
jgi:hypothetical protein